MAKLDNYRTRKATPAHVAKMTAERGWFQQQLFQIESVIHGRWSYWISALARRSISGGPWDQIPQIRFGMLAEPTAGASWQSDTPWGIDAPRSQRLVDMVGSRGEAVANVEYVFNRAWQRGVRLDDAAEWWLWAFGSHNVATKPALPDEIEVLFYCALELHRLIAHGGDWAAHIANSYYGDRGAGRHCGWFPTPMSVCSLNAQMLFEAGEDHRCKTVCDPCVGTGAMLLPVSNYSLRLMGMDIDRIMCRLCEWQAWLYVPWMIWSGEGVIREFGDGLADVAEPAVEAASVEMSCSTRAAAMSGAASAPVGQMLLFGADK